MKKLVFTAVVLIAFSGVSMAENLGKKSVEKVANKKVLLSTDCDVAKFVAFNDARAAGFSVKNSKSASFSVYFTCMALPQRPSEQQ